MSTALVVGILLLLVLIGFVLYIGFYNRNMPFCVNLFGFFSWALLNTVLTDGGEKDKKRVTKIRSYVTPSRDHLPKIKGIVADVTPITVRDGTQIDLFTYTPETILADKEGKPNQLIFFCHGGGWMMANRWATEGIICQYALKTNSVVTYINYRLSPEYHHPTAEHDCYDCLMFMMEHHEEYHFDLNKIVLMGDSAGGQICLSIVHSAREQFNRCLFTKLILLYPSMDVRDVPEGDPTWPERNAVFDETYSPSYKTGCIMAEWYFGDDNRDSIVSSPCLEDDFSMYPPTRIFVCEFDTLKIAARAAYEKMKVVFRRER
ncbi:hypothetical protein WA556_002311 [Blastocystis sp. ATCC 50177/Nand II]